MKNNIMKMMNNSLSSFKSQKIGNVHRALCTKEYPGLKIIIGIEHDPSIMSKTKATKIVNKCMTQKNIANMLGVSQSLVSKIKSK